MSINRKKLGALLCVVAVGIAVASTAGAARQSTTPGVTDHSITIGGTFPFSGPASLYATIAYAEQAYFGYVNAKYHGVNGRKITDITLDDGYNPNTTVTDVKKLVEKDNVFAIVGSLGTEPGLATWGYLNQHKVPQALLATGDAYWGTCVYQPKIPQCKGAKPWTIGWQPDYPGEARLYAKYVLSHQSKPRIGVLMQSDAYGKNYLAGFMAGLGSHKSDVVDTEKYTSGSDPAGIQAHILKLKQKNVNTVVIFATPAYAIAALATEGGLHWSPLTMLNNVSANRLFMLSAESKGATPAGVVSTTYIESQTRQSNLPGMQLAKAIIDSTGNSGLINDFNAGDNNLVYGFAVAWTFVDALKHSGANPTRASFMKALRSLNETGKNSNPFVYPGMVVKTSATHGFPMQQLQFEKWDGTIHDWKTFGNVLTSGH